MKTPWTPGKWNVREGLRAILPETGGSIPVPAYWIEQDERTADQNCVAGVVPRKADAVVMSEAPAMADVIAIQHRAIDSLLATLATQQPTFFPTQSKEWRAIQDGVAILRRIGYPGFEAVTGPDDRD